MNLNTMFGRIHQKTMNQTAYSQNSTIPLMNMKYKMQQSAAASPSAAPTQLVNENAVKSSKLMTWGKPTWYFFHTMAEKVKDEEFANVRKDILDIIYSICVNLPCPECATHAQHYLEKINLNTIQTKDDLKMMLFVFHNYVNGHKKYPIMTLDELNALYSTAITANIINNFISFNLQKNATPKMIASDMFRKRIVLKSRDWLNQNADKFLP
jgi:hypothetical protein